MEKAQVTAHVESVSELAPNAEAGLTTEKNMSLRTAIHRYPGAVCFSMLLSLCLIMEGYDTSLINNFYALEQFRRRFGQPLPDGDYQLTASWMSGLNNGTQVGQIAGLFVAGLIAERFGYKKTIIGALLLNIGFVFLLFFAQNIGMLFAGGLLCGLPWGAFQTLTTTYAADVTPIPLRPMLTTYVNMCWVIGQLVATGVLRSLLPRTDDWAWRLPYAVQWVFIPPILFGVLFAPESPTWLVRHGHLDRARASLRRLSRRSVVTDEDLENTLALLQATDALERRLDAGVSYLDCFRGSNRRRTEITCMAWTAQVACGIWFGGNVTYFLEQAGFDPERSFDFGLGTSFIALAGTLGAWFVLLRVGRRSLYLIGLSTMLAVLLAVGFMGIPGPVPSLGWASGALMMVFVVVYDLTVGPVCYCLVAEIPSTRLRIKTAVIARNTYNIVSILANFLNPPILNPLAWNLRGKGGFVWAIPCTAILVWSCFRLPEPRGRSPAELDVLFEEEISAWKFATTPVDPFKHRSDEQSQ